MDINFFFDKGTATFSYVVSDPQTLKCAIIDPVLNFDLFSGKISTDSADEVEKYVSEKKLQVEWLLETHVHADHLTAAYHLREKLGGKIGISKGVLEVLKYWVPLFDNEYDTPLDGSQFDHLFKEGETFKVGSQEFTVMDTQGHTPACISYLANDKVFVGDTLFMPYVGTARADFPGGSAKTLYYSIQKILSLPDEAQIYTCHDYPLPGNEPQCMSTVAQQKKSNIMVHDGIDEQSYINARNTKDRGLSIPKLLLPALQVNLRAGSLGTKSDNQLRYIKIPLNQL